MRILWVSNSPWAPSGYGSQTRQVCRRLMAAGHEVILSANDGTRGEERTWEGATVLGSGMDRYSRDTVAQDIARTKPDRVIILYDPWVYTSGWQDPFAGMTNVTCWTPVDHMPISPVMIPWLFEHASIAMSKFGFDRLSDLNAALKRDKGHGFPLTYIPHALEKVICPTGVAPLFGKTHREQLGLSADAFLVGIVAANTGSAVHDRKAWSEMVLGAAQFMARHRDAYLYVHTLPVGFEGINLHMLFRACGIDPARVLWADEYLLKKQKFSDADMAAIYTSLDVLLATSGGEGFGLPVLEAQACGTPVIVSNCTAQPELVGETWSPERPGARREASGWIVATHPFWNAPHAAWFAKPDVSQIGLALEDAYEHKGDAGMKAAALAKAAEYDADRVFETYWQPYLASLADDAGRIARAQEKRERRAERNRRTAA